MPTTTLGTAYTEYATLIGAPVGGAVRWGYADDLIGTQHIPFVLYLHGAGGNSGQFQTYTGWDDLRDWLIDNGWGWVESNGGGEQTWGNQAARDGYSATWSHIKSQASIGPVVILARSMGGLVGYWLYAQHPELSDPAVCQGLIVNCGVTDLVAANAAGNFDAYLPAAYGVTVGDGDAAFNAAVAGGWDPMDYDPSLWTGRRVLQVTSTGDGTVPPASHGLAWITAYGSELALLDTSVASSGGHGIPGGYGQVADMSAFLTSVAAEWEEPDPPDPGLTRYHVTQILTTTDGDDRREVVSMAEGLTGAAVTDIYYASTDPVP